MRDSDDELLMELDVFVDSSTEKSDDLFLF